MAKEKKVKSENKGKKKSPVPIILIAVVVLGAAGAFFVLRGGGEKQEKPIIYGYYSPGEFFVTNVKNSTHLLKTAIVLVLNTEDTKVQDKLTAENARIRDAIIFRLRDVTEDDVRSGGEKEQLKQDIIKLINERMNIDNTVDVLFNDFVMQ